MLFEYVFLNVKVCVERNKLFKEKGVFWQQHTVQAASQSSCDDVCYQWMWELHSVGSQFGKVIMDWQSLNKPCQELGTKVVDFVSMVFKLW